MPRNGPQPLTYDDHVHFPEDGRRHEIIGGEHVVSPAPSVRHQDAVGALFSGLRRLIQEAGLGRVFVSPIDVQLSETDVVQPDVVVVLADRSGIIRETRLIGAPSLLVEVLSASTASRDRSLKAHLYARSGVPEYWLVDPERRVVEQHVLEGGAYRLAGAHADRVPLTERPDVALDLEGVW
jgi:Uma2 family endonuclease